MRYVLLKGDKCMCIMMYRRMCYLCWSMRNDAFCASKNLTREHGQLVDCCGPRPTKDRQIYWVSGSLHGVLFTRMTKQHVPQKMMAVVWRCADNTWVCVERERERSPGSSREGVEQYSRSAVQKSASESCASIQLRFLGNTSWKLAKISLR